MSWNILCRIRVTSSNLHHTSNINDQKSNLTVPRFIASSLSYNSFIVHNKENEKTRKGMQVWKRIPTTNREPLSHPQGGISFRFRKMPVAGMCVEQGSFEVRAKSFRSRHITRPNGLIPQSTRQ